MHEQGVRFIQFNSTAWPYSGVPVLYPAHTVVKWAIGWYGRRAGQLARRHEVHRDRTLHRGACN